MPCFVCDNCGSIENTALCFYWSRKNIKYKDKPECNDKALCSECTPEYFDDGSKTGCGKWHDKFPKEHWSVKYETKPEGFL